MNQTQRENHTAKERRLQVIFPLDLGLKLPEDDSLRLLIEITEEMDFRELYAAYERREAAGEATAKQLFQLVVFGFMNGYYSLRSITAACRYDIRMMYLLQGKKAPILQLSHTKHAFLRIIPRNLHRIIKKMQKKRPRYRINI